MPFARALPLLFLLLAIGLSGCVEDKDYGEADDLRPEVNRNTNTKPIKVRAEDSTVKLESLINIPVEAEENEFRIDAVAPPEASEEASETKEQVLTVVLRYTDENAAKVRELIKEKKSFEAKVSPEQWFPVELTAKADASGGQEISGTGYEADDFAKDPWSKGTIIEIPETNFFVLTLRKLSTR